MIPVLAWADIQNDPERRRRYQQARGKGGLVRVDLGGGQRDDRGRPRAHHQDLRPRPRRRFLTDPGDVDGLAMPPDRGSYKLIGGAMTSFYDWYADLPVASPQVFGDQTDVPESGDWWDAAYLMMWGSNVPITRTPDAHWMAEARYRGAESGRGEPGLRRQHQVRRRVDAVRAPAPTARWPWRWATSSSRNAMCATRFRPSPTTSRRYTDLPFLIKLDERGDMLVPGKFLTGGRSSARPCENAAFKPALFDEATGNVVVPHGSLGFRYGEDGVGKWNLDLGTSDPALSVRTREPRRMRRRARIDLPSFDTVDGDGHDRARAVSRYAASASICLHRVRPDARPIRGRATGPARRMATGYDDATQQNTPAWQEAITGVSAAQAIRVAREFAHNAEESGGRSMIIMGGGICHWFHSDAIYRAVLALLMLTGSMGRNGGGWAHYVGQEKVRPLTGFQTMAMATDWTRPPRQVPGASYWYAHTDQWRYDGYGADKLASPVGRRQVRRQAHDRPAGVGGGDGLEPVLPAVRPLQPGRRRRGARRRTRRRRICRRAARPAQTQAGRHRSRQPGQLAAGAYGVARQPDRLVGQGRRVLPASPAGHRLQRDGAAAQRRRAAPRRELRGRHSRGQARLDDVDRLPA